MNRSTVQQMLVSAGLQFNQEPWLNEPRRNLTVKKSGSHAIAWAGHRGHGSVCVQNRVVLQHLVEHGAVNVPSTEDENTVGHGNRGMIGQRRWRTKNIPTLVKGKLLILS